MERDKWMIFTFIRYIYPSKQKKEKEKTKQKNRNNDINYRKLLKGPKSTFEGPFFL